MTIMRLTLTIPFFMCFLACFNFNRNLQAAESIVIAVHPFLSASEINTKFTPLVNYLNRETGYDFTIKVGSNYDEHIEFIGKDKVDIAYMGPASYVLMTEKYGDKPGLAKLEVKGRSYFKGVIIARIDSGIRTLKDLKGKRIAFGDRNSTMSYIVPHFMLHEAGVFEKTNNNHDFLHSHTNVALGVLTGDYDAGAVKPAVYEKFKKDGLLVVAETPEISEHLFVANNQLSKLQRNTIRDALLNAGNTTSGKRALKSIKSSITNLVITDKNDYENLRHIIVNSRDLH